MVHVEHETRTSLLAEMGMGIYLRGGDIEKAHPELDDANSYFKLRLRWRGNIKIADKAYAQAMKVLALCMSADNIPWPTHERLIVIAGKFNPGVISDGIPTQGMDMVSADSTP